MKTLRFNYRHIFLNACAVLKEDGIPTVDIGHADLLINVENESAFDAESALEARKIKNGPSFAGGCYEIEEC
jgi:hypothetical protein